jgi:hypothetical protein
VVSAVTARYRTRRLPAAGDAGAPAGLPVAEGPPDCNRLVTHGHARAATMTMRASALIVDQVTVADLGGRWRFRQVRCMRHTTVDPVERLHSLVRGHQQLDRVLSEIEADLF